MISNMVGQISIICRPMVALLNKVAREAIHMYFCYMIWVVFICMLDSLANANSTRSRVGDIVETGYGKWNGVLFFA